MSDQPKPAEFLTKSKTSIVAPDAANTSGVIKQDRGVHFLPETPEPDDSHKQLVLEALEQMFVVEAHSVFLDPTSENFRLCLGTPEGLSELGMLPLAHGRVMLETIKRQSTLRVSSENAFGKFYDGVMRVEFRNAERRLRVHLMPTAHGLAATLKTIPSLPQDAGDFLALGMTEVQAELVTDLLINRNGLFFVGGTDLAQLSGTISVLTSRAVQRGRRSGLIAADAGPDVANVVRIETGHDEQHQAQAILNAAEAGIGCLALEFQPTPKVTQAAALAVMRYQAEVLIPVVCKSAPETIGWLLTQELTGEQRTTALAATFQLQIPLLCSNCARWGEVTASDLSYFDVKSATGLNFYVRHNCDQCGGQIQAVAPMFEVLPLNETSRALLKRKNLAFQDAQGELNHCEGYVGMKRMIVEAAQVGRCSLGEARQYLEWQVSGAK